MFGTNPLRKKVTNPGETLKVVDVFSTIQGEGPRAGQRAVFVRLWGCHLKCYFCDTDFESNVEEYTAQGLAAKVTAYNIPLVVLTGGEPMRQPIAELLCLLTRCGITAQIETAGSFWFSKAEEKQFNLDALENVEFVVSPKTPIVDDNVRAHAKAWKYIVSCTTQVSDEGIPFADFQQTAAIRKLAAPGPTVPRSAVYIQPMDIPDRPEQNKLNVEFAVELCMKYGYSLSLQQHKIVGLP